MPGPLFAIDTTLDACSTAVLSRDGAVLADLSAQMNRGHAEAVAPMAREALAAAGLRFKDLRALAVTTGPGSFTGVRVGIAFQRALAVALSIPCIGLSTLEVLALGRGASGARIGAISTPGGLYLAGWINAVLALPPQRFDAPDAAIAALRAAGLSGASAFGSGAAALWEGVSAHPHGPLAVDLARLALGREPAAYPPVPLYLRAPDAKLPAA
jgi:tRNA threonylcarbamoyladenosine biosynthesis protein TsaB